MKTGWFPNAERLCKSLDPRVLLASGLLLWSVLALLLALLPAGSTSQFVAAVAASWMAQAFAGVALLWAVSRRDGAERLAWGLFGGAVAARLAWDVLRVGLGAFGFGMSPTLQVTIHAFSYVLFFVVLLYLVNRIGQETVSVAALDALSVILTSGLLVWYFALDSGAGLDALSVLALLARPGCDLGILFLALALLFTVRRPPFVVLMTAGTALLLAADGAYVWLRVAGEYSFGGPAEVLWSGGVMLLGFAVLAWGGAPVARAPHVGNFGVGLFWFGPLSPPLQYGALLLWGAFYGPLPPYVLLGGATFMVLLAVRMYAITHVNELLSRRQEALALQAEQGRILRGLHDTVKQDIHGASMMIEASIAAQKEKDAGTVREILERALEASREASRELLRPLDELRAATGHDAEEPMAFFRERLAKLERFYGMKTHENLEVPLEELGREEILVAQQVFVEAVWNAARHSGAGNFWLSTRREGALFVLQMRDDGRGYAPEEATGGLGMGLTRSRAEGVGAVLRVSSAPGEGTAVEVRFGGRR
ncbi:MAG: histidine kinase [Actinomycetota bacterium]|nr:histidine kinase [Actinomycetota bacterium]